MTKSLGIGLIGSKFMGRTHSNGWSQAPRFFDLPATPVLRTIAARDEEDLKTFAPRWGWSGYTTQWRDLCNDEGIDVIDIGTPNHVHKDMALAALEAGKHVACEKPLAATLDDAREMVEAARKASGSQTFVWYNYRRTPALALAHNIIREGKLGRIYHVRCFYLQDWAGPDTPMLWRFQGDVAGSGSLGDLCAHSIDTARFLTGEEIHTVQGAIMKTFIEQRKVIKGGAGGEISGHGAAAADEMAKSTVDDATLFTAEFTGGAIATFEATRLSTGDKNGNRIEIHGENGAIKFDFERMCELEWYDATLPPHLQGWSTINVSNGNTDHPYAGNYWPAAHAIGYEHTFVNMAADIVRSLKGQQPPVPLCDFEDAYKTQRVLAAVTASAENHCPVKLDEIK